jgi:hypothetical protein
LIFLKNHHKDDLPMSSSSLKGLISLGAGFHGQSPWLARVALAAHARLNIDSLDFLINYIIIHSEGKIKVFSLFFARNENSVAA